MTQLGVISCGASWLSESFMSVLLWLSALDGEAVKDFVTIDRSLDSISFPVKPHTHHVTGLVDQFIDTPQHKGHRKHPDYCPANVTIPQLSQEIQTALALLVEGFCVFNEIQFITSVCEH